MNARCPIVGRMSIVLSLMSIVAAGPAAAAQSTAIVGGTLIDGTGSPPRGESVVVIRGGTIAAVGSTASIELPPDATVIDARGQWIIPGLVDVHAHFFESGRSYMRPGMVDLTALVPYEEEVRWTKARVPVTLARYLCSGVTTVASLGGPRFEREVRGRAAAAARAPAVYAAYSPVSTTPQVPALFPPFDGDDATRTVVAAADARAEVRAAASAGADFLKTGYLDLGTELMPPDLVRRYWTEVLPALIDESRTHALPVVAHVETLEAAKRHVSAGVSRLAHPFADLPVDEEFVTLARERGAIVASSLSAMRRPVEIFAHAPNLQAAERRCGDPEVIASWRDLPSATLPEGVTAEIEARAERGQRNVKALFDAGISLAVGSDAGNLGLLHGASLHYELKLMADAGVPPAALLVAATRNGARFLGKDDRVGTIENGKDADLLVLDRDPLADIQNLDSIRIVIRAGAVYDEVELRP